MSPVDRSRLPEVGPDPHFRLPAVVRHTLGNGMRVWTVEHWSVPVLTFTLQIRGGSGADPSGAEGLAALTADMADEGSGSRTALDIADALARIGGDYDLDVGGDATAFSLTTLERFGARGAALLADMVVRPSLRLHDFERVRQQRLNRLQQLKDVPSTVADQGFLRLLYKDHPYGHLAIGRERALAGLTLDHVAGFHARSFTPGRATLIACGAMSHQAMLSCVEAAFGSWAVSAGPDPEPSADAMPVEGDGPTFALIPREGAAQSELRIGQLTTARTTPDYPALVVMNAVLGGQFVSRLNLKLREEKGYTYGARTGFDWRRGISPFMLQTSVQTAATADAVSLSLSEIGGIASSRPPSDAELSLAKASLTRGYPRGFETAQQVARAVSQIALYGLPDDYFEQFVPNVNAVTSRDVVDAASRHLNVAKLTTLIVGDHSAIAASLAGLGLGDPAVLQAEQNGHATLVTREQGNRECGPG